MLSCCVYMYLEYVEQFVLHVCIYMYIYPILQLSVTLYPCVSYTHAHIHVQDTDFLLLKIEHLLLNAIIALLNFITYMYSTLYMYTCIITAFSQCSIFRHSHAKILFMLLSCTHDVHITDMHVHRILMQMHVHSIYPYSEWLVNQHRDSFASYIGHPNLMEFFSVAENESKARVKFSFLQVQAVRTCIHVVMFIVAFP